MKDISPFTAIAEALQQLIEVSEKSASNMPPWQRTMAAEACERARTARSQLLTWIDEARG